MKKFASILILLILSVYSVSAQTRITSANLRLRSSDSVYSEILSVIPAGTALRVLGDTANGWCMVIYNNHLGYVHQGYLWEKKNTGTAQSAWSQKLYANAGGSGKGPIVRSGSSHPAGATARCADGTYSYSQHRQGTCSHHGGVAQWL